MNVHLQFLGAAGSVTGSKYLLRADSLRILVDCGLFQGVKELRLRNWDPLPLNPAEIDAVIITHAHIDHIGYLPRLVKDGYKGPIYMTPATEELAQLLLRDSAKLQEEEAEYANKKGYSKHHPAKALYTVQDAERVFPLIRTLPCEESLHITHAISFRYRTAGHILGAAIVELWIHAESGDRKITFSGDLGRYDQPIMPDPTAIDQTDILLLESTYGNRNNPYRNVLLDMARIINETFETGGCVLIPSFAVGRTQELLYYIHTLITKEAIPEVPVFVDSPMATSATLLYQHHHAYHKLSAQEAANIFDAPWVQYVRSQEDSTAINNRKSHAIIISASGMCTGGRVLHHLYNRLGNPQDTVLLAGYQAEGTRGRDIQEKQPTVRIFGVDVGISCRVETLQGLSAHADLSELRMWLSNFPNAPKRTYLVHGEPEAATMLQRILQHDHGWPNVFIPEYGETVSLYEGI
ncbi:MAG: MBL fold metallo-hydrolase [Bacteroidetes bacterium]|nr:MBL fold metallo-hydrolase [Bacteroidota bacterium]